MENFLDGLSAMCFSVVFFVIFGLVSLALNGFKDPGEPPEPLDGI